MKANNVNAKLGNHCGGWISHTGIRKCNINKPAYIFKMKCTIFISIDSKVFTPASHPQDWLLVKAELEQAADTFCQARLHLGGVHWVSTIYCLSFRRHLSTQHPLYDFFKYHCEGTVPHISLSWPALSLPGSAGHQLFSIGHEGFIRLST